MNKELYEKCMRAAALLIGVEALSEEIEKRELELQELCKKEKHLKSHSEKKPNSTATLIILPIVLFLLSITVAVAFIVGGGMGVIMAFRGGSEAGIGFTLLMLAFGGVLLLIGIGVLLLPLIVFVKMLHSNTKHKKEAPKKYEEFYKNTYLPESERLSAEITDLKEKRSEFQQVNADALEFLPVDYRDIVPITFIFTAVKNCRADTLKEALNLFEQERRHWEQMQALQEVAAMQEEYYDVALSEIRHNSAVLEDIRFLEIANFIATVSD